MVVPLIPIAMALAQFAPTIAGLLGGKKAEDVAGKVVEVAKAVTGQSSPDAAVAALQSDPMLAYQFQVKVVEAQGEIEKMAHELDMAELQAETDQVKSINETIRTELANSDKEEWYQKAWRPFCGFSLGLGTLVGVYFTCILFASAISSKDMTALTMLPQLTISLTGLLAIPGAAVGIASWKRGSQKIEREKRLSQTS